MSVGSIARCNYGFYLRDLGGFRKILRSVPFDMCSYTSDRLVWTSDETVLNSYRNNRQGATV
jgi:hypothetical protein